MRSNHHHHHHHYPMASLPLPHTVAKRHLHEVMSGDVRRKVVRFELHAAALYRVTVGHLNHRHHRVAPGSNSKRQQPGRLFCTKFAPAGVVVAIAVDDRVIGVSEKRKSSGSSHLLSGKEDVLVNNEDQAVYVVLDGQR